MEKNITSVSEFVEAIVSLEFSKGGNANTHAIWFRGEGSRNWKTRLMPSSYRGLIKADMGQNREIPPRFAEQIEKIKRLEKRVESEFYRRTPRYLSDRAVENSQWNRYFLMQHYKIQTRLLDWTENALLALFFAISDTSIDNDAVVYVLKPHFLNDSTFKTITGSSKPFLKIPSGDGSVKRKTLINDAGEIRLRELTRRFLQMDFVKEENNKEAIYNPLAIYPTYLDNRMTAQKACFTIFGNNVDGLYSNFENHEFLESVSIEGGATKANMLDELRMLGIDFESVFPDLDGLGLSIQSKFQKDFTYDSSLKIQAREDFRVFLKGNKEEDD